jgi:hypothetical protein
MVVASFYAGVRHERYNGQQEEWCFEMENGAPKNKAQKKHQLLN